MAAVTWNPADKDANIVLSNGNLTATGGSGTLFNGVRATRFASAGKLYSEYVIVADSATVGSNGSWAVGNSISSGPLTSIILGSAASQWGYYPWSGLFYIAGTVSFIQADQTNGHVVQVAIDLGGKLIWVKTQASNWNNSAPANPATGTGGASIAAMTAGALAPTWAAGGSAVVTANFGASAFAFSVPAGFSAWGDNPSSRARLLLGV
jgi:hypothetical protein